LSDRTQKSLGIRHHWIILTAKALFEGGIQRGAGLTDRCLIEG